MHLELQFQIALTLIPGIGPVKAKGLIAYCGSAQAVFREKESALIRIPDIGKMTIGSIGSLKHEALSTAEKEMLFMDKHGITAMFYTDEHYPARLRHCEDSPIILYNRGQATLNPKRAISIVGTRNATNYGVGFCKELLEGIAHYRPLVVSGLAYGIDIHAHRQCLQLGIPTVGVTAHGLETVYPAQHAATARDMEAQGGLVSEFITHTKMAPEMFPMRNRIVAGMTDCTIVVESDKKGGSLITAQLANSYGREVFALPGRYQDKFSGGCNELIRKNIAAILTSAEELVEYLNWDQPEYRPTKQLRILYEPSAEEQDILSLLQAKGKLSIDQLAEATQLPQSRLSGLLLHLEFENIIKSLPGKQYELFE